jgi:hypothetical protein
MTFAANSTIVLNNADPAKDAIVVIGTPTGTITDDGIAVRFGTNVPLGLRQSIVGQLEALRRFALTNLYQNPTTVSITYNESDLEVNGAHGADRLTLVFGLNVRTSERSQVLDSSMDKVIQVFLEQTKAQ